MHANDRDSVVSGLYCSQAESRSQPLAPFGGTLGHDVLRDGYLARFAQGRCRSPLGTLILFT
jgi:hypothetical protein